MDRETGWTEHKNIVYRRWDVVKGHLALPVQRVLTYLDSEFVVQYIDAWYKERGIEHVKVRPKSSHMNFVERQHQSLGNMTKTMLRESGLSPTLCPSAFKYNVYLLNRT